MNWCHHGANIEIERIAKLLKYSYRQLIFIDSVEKIVSSDFIELLVLIANGAKRLMLLQRVSTPGLRS